MVAGAYESELVITSSQLISPLLIYHSSSHLNKPYSTPLSNPGERYIGEHKTWEPLILAKPKKPPELHRKPPVSITSRPMATEGVDHPHRGHLHEGDHDSMGESTLVSSPTVHVLGDPPGSILIYNPLIQTDNDLEVLPLDRAPCITYLIIYPSIYFLLIHIPLRIYIPSNVHLIDVRLSVCMCGRCAHAIPSPEKEQKQGLRKEQR